jgi:hypothetical protein
MSRQQFVLDSRLPASDTQPESDPNHPKNVMRNSQIVSAQANADTRYDIYPPPRVDAFTDINAIQTISPIYLILGSLLVALISIFICLKVKNIVVRIGFVGLAITSLHYAVGKLENLTV